MTRLLTHASFLSTRRKLASSDITPTVRKANNDLTVTAVSSGGTNSFAGWSTILGNGENRILVLSKSGYLMQSVTLNAVDGAEAIGGFDELKQTEISGLTRKVPEPGTLLLLGLGLVGLAGLRRKF